MENLDYFMLKPESQRYFSEILDYIQKQNIEIKQFYKVHDWKNLSKLLYSREFENNEEFRTGFESLSYITDSLYGNNAIILIIKPSVDMEEKEFAEKVVKIKKEIRDIYKKSDRFFLIGNALNMPINDNDKKINGTIKIQDASGSLQEVPKGNEKGMYQFHSFNYVHCPDEAQVQREFQILNEKGILNEENMISAGEIEEIKKYKSFIF